MAFSKIPIGEKAPESINVVIEIPRGSHHKFEYDEGLDEICLDRVLHSPVFYPADYGFIPQTTSGDGDSLDAFVFITEPLFPGCVVKVRPIGLLDMEDESGKDWKIVAVAEKDPRLKSIQSVDDLDEHYKKEIEQFFEVYKKLEPNKWAKVNKWLGKEEALRNIREAMERFRESA